MISSSRIGFQRGGAKEIPKATGKAISRQKSVVSPEYHRDLAKICR